MRVLVLPCDGTGPEIISSALKALFAVDDDYHIDFQFEYDDVRFLSLEKYGTTLRDEVLENAKTFEGIISGTQSHMDYPPVSEGEWNVSAGFRIGLDLYANIRPARSRLFLGKGIQGMDLVIMREATECFYPDRNMIVGWAEMIPSADMAISVRKITAYCSEMIARRAFELAMKRRKKVSAVHKVNSFKLTDGLFLDKVREVAEDFLEVALEDVLIDAMTAHLVRDAAQFDVIVATNFYGDILSNLASELSGSLGLACSIMASDWLCSAQAQHGSAPDIQGQDIANPTSMILSIAMMLRWIEENRNEQPAMDAGNAMKHAVDSILINPECRTADLDGSVRCQAFSELVAAAIRQP